jgi:hypothetical protein
LNFLHLLFYQDFPQIVDRFLQEFFLGIAQIAGGFIPKHRQQIDKKGGARKVKSSLSRQGVIDFTEMDHALGGKHGYDRPDIGCHRYFLALQHQRKYNIKKKDIQTAAVIHPEFPP